MFEAVVRELDSGWLGLAPDRCRPFKRKGYHSRDRDDNIILDVSIEVWIPGADTWSILWACECKDYGRPLPVDDVEEFKAKLDQVAGVNKKGFLALSGAMQRSALAYARSNGIGVLRLLPDAQVTLVMALETIVSADERLSLDSRQAELALTEPGFFSCDGGDLYGEWQGQPVRRWSDALRILSSAM